MDSNKRPTCNGLAEKLEATWVIITNSNSGNWEKANPEWRKAAERWRDAYHASPQSFTNLPEQEQANLIGKAAEAANREQKAVLDEAREHPWETEPFKILEAALQHQGIKKPLTKEFYDDLAELNAYVQSACSQAARDARNE